MPDLPYNDLDKFAKCKPEKIFQMSPREIAAASEHCLNRVKNLAKHLQELVVGQEENIRIMIASAIAQQPSLMIGPPGVAKTLLAVKFFELLGLRRPDARPDDDPNLNPVQSINGFFEYLLHTFSIPDEIFGPYDISAMRGQEADPSKGLKRIRSRMIRINENMLTGPGVRGCFLDEVFKANSAILNTMLTLINERKYFNDSKFHRSDLRVIIGASNETPTAKGDVWAQSKVASELRAFYDRWTMRMQVLAPNNPLRQQMESTPYERVHRAARKQIANRFHSLESDYEPPVSSINDLILLGRCLIAPAGEEETYREKGIHVAAPSGEFTNLLLKLGRGLDEEEKATYCTMNPRKLVYGEMVARAHALLKGGIETEMSNRHLVVFRYIWDDESKVSELANAVNGLINCTEALLQGEERN